MNKVLLHALHIFHFRHADSDSITGFERVIKRAVTLFAESKRDQVPEWVEPKLQELKHSVPAENIRKWLTRG